MSYWHDLLTKIATVCAGWCLDSCPVVHYASLLSRRLSQHSIPCLCNQLPSSLRQPHSSPSVSDLPVHAPATSSYSLNLPLSPSITPSLFHSRLKTYLFHKSFPRQTPFRPQDWLHGFMTGPFLPSSLVFIFSFFVSLFCLDPCGRVSWPYVSFWAHVNIIHRIISYHIIS